MARPGRPERNRTARSFRQLRRFHRFINSDKVFGTHKPGNIIRCRRSAIRRVRTMTRDRAAMNGSNRALGDLDRGLGETPADPELWVLRALALMKAGSDVEAADAWPKAV